jgi:hypothetical protein
VHTGSSDLSGLINAAYRYSFYGASLAGELSISEANNYLILNNQWAGRRVYLFPIFVAFYDSSRSYRESSLFCSRKINDLTKI